MSCKGDYKLTRRGSLSLSPDIFSVLTRITKVFDSIRIYDVTTRTCTRVPGTGTGTPGTGYTLRTRAPLPNIEFVKWEMGLGNVRTGGN